MRLRNCTYLYTGVERNAYGNNSILEVSDILFFGNYSQIIMDSYSVKPTILYLIASVIYGGVIEEVMLRLFWMSLVTFILWKAPIERMRVLQ